MVIMDAFMLHLIAAPIDSPDIRTLNAHMWRMDGYFNKWPAYMAHIYDKMLDTLPFRVLQCPVDRNGPYKGTPRKENMDMYISIKLPPAFGSFNQLRKENYPFSSLFTAYLAAVSRLGLALGADVDELVGYIEDRVFDGQRLPDIPEGNEAVVMRYKTEDPDVVKYIGQSRFTNRMAVMCIARMTLRLSAAYGTSLFRLTKLISDLDPAAEPARKPKAEPKPKEPAKPRPKPKAEPREEEPAKDGLPVPGVRIRQAAEPAEAPAPAPVSQASKSAEAAKAALAELAGLTAQAPAEPDAQEQDDGGREIVQTNPLLSQFM